MRNPIRACLVGIYFGLGAFPALASDHTVRIAGVNYLADAPTVIADSLNLFAAQGLDGRIERLESGKEALARLRAGQADFALMALTPLVLDRLADPTPRQSDDPVILASLTHSTNMMQIVALGESGIETPDDMVGRRIGVAQGTNSAFVWWLFQRFHDISSSSHTLVDRSGSELAESLLSGQIDVAVLWQPWIARVEQQLASEDREALRYFNASQLYAGKWVLVTTRQLAKDRTALSQQVLSAYHEATGYMERQPGEAMNIYVKRMDISHHYVEHHWDAFDYDLNLDWSLIAGLQMQFFWARAAGYENRGGPVYVLDAIDSEPLRDKWPSTVGIPSPSGGADRP